MIETLATLEIAGVTYDIGKLTAREQFHIGRKLAPVVVPIAVAQDSLKDFSKLLESPDGIVKMTALMEPIMQCIAEMKEEDADYILNGCLKAVSKASGKERYPLLDRNNNFMFELPLPDLMQLAYKVVEVNMSGFFTTDQSDSVQKESPQNLPQ